MTVDSGAPPRRAAALAALAALAVAALATGLAGIAGAAPPTQRHYPPAVRRQFTAACARTATQVAVERLTNRQARRLCTVTLSCMERRLTFRQSPAPCPCCPCRRSSSCVPRPHHPSA